MVARRLCPSPTYSNSVRRIKNRHHSFGHLADTAHSLTMDGGTSFLGDKSGEDIELDGTTTHTRRESNFTSTSATNDSRDEASDKRRSRQQSRSRSRSLERSWSLSDGLSTGVDHEADEAGEETDSPDGFTVHWDENDPMNPRSMSMARRLMIVIIVSMGSLCV